MKKAIGYVRVSTERQGQDDKYGIEVQKESIEKYAATHDYEIVSWSIDVVSGVKDNRPELDKLLYSPEELPGHDAVIVFKNDRLARDTKLYFYYLYTLEKRNVKLLSTQEQFSEGAEFANIYRSLLLFVAEEERKNIALRTSKGRREKARCGGYSGGRPPYGYEVRGGKLVLNPSEVPIVREIFSEKQKGKTLADISEVLYDMGYRTRKGKRFQVSTVKSVLDNAKFYAGLYRYGNTEWVRGVHEPILEGVFV